MRLSAQMTTLVSSGAPVRCLNPGKQRGKRGFLGAVSDRLPAGYGRFTCVVLVLEDRDDVQSQTFVPSAVLQPTRP